MNYEKAYKEALERAKNIHNEHRAQCHDVMTKVFPELAESEDERIRKEILNVVKQLDENSTICGEKHNYNKWIAWLEKQNERKQIEYVVPETPIKDSEEVTSRMKYVDDNLKPIAEFIMDYASWDLRKDEWNHPVATIPLFRVLDALVQKGKQYSEEHSIVNNNTEPKFKVGDWITNGVGYPCYIQNMFENHYELCSNNGFEYTKHIKDVDNYFHLWNINDAKDGDVLALEWKDACHWQKIVIFKSLNEFGVEGYGTTFKNNKLAFMQDVPFYSKTWTKYLHPATKEQRDLLFQKMKEAGYEWDAEKKQLTKKQS